MNELSKQPTSKNGTPLGLRDSIALAELYPLYGLQPASKDILSCTILAGVMARELIIARKAQKEEGAALVTKESFDEILAELKTTVGNWDGVDAIQPKRTVHWMRRNVRYIVGAARREKAVQPWLQEFGRQVKSGQASERGSLAAN